MDAATRSAVNQAARVRSRVLKIPGDKRAELVTDACLIGMSDATLPRTFINRKSGSLIVRSAAQYRAMLIMRNAAQYPAMAAVVNSGNRLCSTYSGRGNHHLRISKNVAL